MKNSATRPSALFIAALLTACVRAPTWDPPEEKPQPPPAAKPPAGPLTLRDRAEKRNEALVAQGYNLTHSWSFRREPHENPLRLDLVVPVDEVEHIFNFWAETHSGQISVRLVRPDTSTASSWTGKKGELVFSFKATPGNYAVEIEQTADADGRAVLGIKGPTIPRCQVNGGSVREYAASTSHGFYWPYLLFMPDRLKNARLLVAPNNTGFETEDVDMLRASATCQAKQLSSLAIELGVPLLIPMFPRPVSSDSDSALYLHALSRASFETRVTKYQRVDLQLIAMIRDAVLELQKRHEAVAERALLFGFSASGSFVNRFAMLHPDHVLAVATGSPGGWPLVPVEKVEEDVLYYPVGVAGLSDLTGEPLDTAELQKINWYFFLGAEDLNDAVVHRDSFSKPQEDLIFRRFGKTPAARWQIAEKLYVKRGLSAKFVLYPKVSHLVTPEMKRDVVEFFERSLRAHP